MLNLSHTTYQINELISAEIHLIQPRTKLLAAKFKGYPSFETPNGFENQVYELLKFPG